MQLCNRSSKSKLSPGNAVVALSSALLAPLLLSAPGLCDDGTFQCGVRLFNSGRYTGAIRYFEAAQREAPYDARVLYYEGLCQHRMGHIAAARSFYQQVVDKFPDSDAAEMAKQGLGTVDYGSGYDRPGGTLAKLDRLRMDIVPAEATLNCQEQDGKPVVVATVDGKKISFIVDPSASNTYIGSDLVRSNSLNDVPIVVKQGKANKGAKPSAPAKTGKESEAIHDQKTVTDPNSSSEMKDGTAASTSGSATASTSNSTSSSGSNSGSNSGSSSGSNSGSNSGSGSAQEKSASSNSKGTAATIVSANRRALSNAKGQTDVIAAADAKPDSKPESHVDASADGKEGAKADAGAESKAGANAGTAKDAGAGNASAAGNAGDKGATAGDTTTGNKESNKESNKEADKFGPEDKLVAPSINDSNVVLYDIILGPVQRPGFPVFINTSKPKQAVLGRDFLGPYKVTFNATAKTLNLVRDHSYDNPFGAGMAFLNKGKYKQAVPLLKRASDNRPADPRPLYCYAIALQRSGNIEGARAAYRQVHVRFPNSEANFYSVAALNAIDPSFVKEMLAAKVDAQGKIMSTSSSAQKNIVQFDVPYTIEATWIKVSARIDGVPVEMWADLNRPDMQFSSGQLAAVNPSYLDDLTEVSRTTDDSNNLMMTTVVKTGFLKKVTLGNAEKYHAPIRVTDTGPLKYINSWTGTTGRPIIPLVMFSDWRFEVMDGLKVIRFVRLPNSYQR